MTVKDVIKLTATLLGRENIIEYLKTDEGDSNTLYQVDVMTRCANIVINELSTTYVPMCICEDVMPVDGKVYFVDLKESPLKILKVYSSNGKETNFSFHHEYLITPDARKIEYQYIPANYGITDTVGYKERQVPVRVLAYGTAAEYCLTERAFDDAVTWHKKYMDAIQEICSPKNVMVKHRRFV